MNWEEYFNTVVRVFREEFSKLSEEVQKVIQNEFFDRTFLKPCQVEILDSGQYSVIWFIVHDKQLDDIEITVHRNAQNANVSEFTRRYSFFADTASEVNSLLVSKSKLVFAYTNHNKFAFPRNQNPELFAKSTLRSLSMDASSKLASKRFAHVDGFFTQMRSAISKVSQEGVRTELADITEKIDSALKEIQRIDEHERKLNTLEEDIGGVRKMIGASEKYQDWRVLASDVAALKGVPHVSKEAFDSEIKRLDQRIETLKEIKFWSKRTVIDLILAVIATASTTIATLLATGNIKNLKISIAHTYSYEKVIIHSLPNPISV